MLVFLYPLSSIHLYRKLYILSMRQGENTHSKQVSSHDKIIIILIILVNKIRTRQTTFFGHVMRREKLEHLITTGMMEGKRSRGKQREKMTDGLANWLGAGKVVEILKATRDRGIWKDMIANATKHGTG